jgi:5-methylcytosine-specific restriction endonuclease McrA
MSATASTSFQRLKSDADRKAFYTELKVSPWWLGGTKRSSTFGWVDVFEKSDGKCVYCSRDLAASTDALAESTEEHLVPRSLLEASGVKFDNEHNMAVCCAGCNGLKNDNLPPSAHPCWSSRKAFIKECSRFIAECRLRNFQKYKAHVEKVLKRRAGQ